MALACKCDRCKKFFSPTGADRVTKIKVGKFSIREDCRGPIEITDYDLCDSCADTLKFWLNEYGKMEMES